MEPVKISSADYMRMQPGYPEQFASDKFYYGLSQELLKKAADTHLANRYGMEVIKDIVLAVVGYYQDVVSDAGLWRTMCTIHNDWYGKWLPIFPIDDDYVESELNLTDIRLLIWYILETKAERRGEISPFDADILQLAEVLHKPLEEYYDFAPEAEGFSFLREMEIYNPEHTQQVYDFSYWLFWNSYLLRPAAGAVMRRSLDEGQRIVRKYANPDDARDELLELNHRLMKESPTGPLALHTRDWLHAIVDNKLPKKPQAELLPTEHTLIIPDTHHKLITDIENYNPQEVKHIFSQGLAPKAQFAWEKPGDRVLLDNWDFFARLYGQGHYTGTK